ncbi:MAG: hypothetical protein U5L10_02150 [Candidatus Moranbacteria bacterium]|nr:hypothetical protein [Candidatus Moranbacteria bacterium]
MRKKTVAEKTKELGKESKQKPLKNKDAEKDLRITIEELKKDKELEQKVIDAVTTRLAKKILSGPQKELEKEIEKRAKNIKLAEIIDRVLERKECPWLKNDNWDCSKSGCKKDGGPECRTIDFVNCPAVNHYFKNQITSKMMAWKKKMEKGDGTK